MWRWQFWNRKAERSAESRSGDCRVTSEGNLSLLCILLIFLGHVLLSHAANVAALSPWEGCIAYQ
ncbi:hypothetical protein BDV29DRAFT_183950 [Aspergillus leporis]|uniref:Uncharacterized protein n=1 Tax=Aspergillus leporis TaxID=41062 RepID=A0A5N5WJT3_9EURO|nr:hypothetical protein BDV29DRAFT_183950 [Aspergillus leporis]